MSTGDEASKFARFAFRRHFIQHAGFRIARSLQMADKINVPARLVKDEVFVLGIGVEGKNREITPIIITSKGVHFVV